MHQQWQIATRASLPFCEELSLEDHRERARTPDRSDPDRVAPGPDSPCFRAGPPFYLYLQVRQTLAHTEMDRDCAGIAPVRPLSVFRPLRAVLLSHKHTPGSPSYSL